MPHHISSELPLPFYQAGWHRDKRDAALALWDWHLALRRVKPSEFGDKLSILISEAVANVKDGSAISLVQPSVAEATYRACRKHNLPMPLLADQVSALNHLRSPVRFATHSEVKTFVQLWAGAHARLLAQLAGLTGSWQLPLVDELAHAFFLTGHLARLDDDLQQDRLFIALEAFPQPDTDLEALQRGEITEPLRRVLWGQLVRARDGFAQGQSLVNDLDRQQALAFKQYWLGGLEVLVELERRDFDVWSQPLLLHPMQRWRLLLQAFAGRTVFKR